MGTTCKVTTIVLTSRRSSFQVSSCLTTHLEPVAHIHKQQYPTSGLTCGLAYHDSGGGVQLHGLDSRLRALHHRRRRGEHNSNSCGNARVSLTSTDSLIIAERGLCLAKCAQEKLYSSVLLGYSFIETNLSAIRDKLGPLHNHWANKPVLEASDLPYFHVHVPVYGKSKVGTAPGQARAYPGLTHSHACTTGLPLQCCGRSVDARRDAWTAGEPSMGHHGRGT